jgi:hypothetical protein
MTSLKQLSWLKYVIFAVSVVVADLIWRRLPRTEQTPSQSLLWAVIMIMPLVVLFIVHKIWPSDSNGQPSTNRWIAFFVFYFVLLIFEFSRPSRPSLQFGIVDHAVAAGNGLLLPGLMLAIFISFMLLKWRKKS